MTYLGEFKGETVFILSRFCDFLGVELLRQELIM